jgi:hypothetical protein
MNTTTWLLSHSLTMPLCLVPLLLVLLVLLLLQCEAAVGGAAGG